MFYIFESQAQRTRDERELRDILMRYGDQASAVLRARAEDRSLDDRNRKHWARLARKMPRFERREAAGNRMPMGTHAH
jgi:hypothetical protein